MNFLQKSVAALLLPVSLASVVSTARADAEAAPLKDAFRSHFKIGTAVSGGLVAGQGWRRTADQVKADVALVQKHFNQVVAENEMKWASLHPRAGRDGYEWKQPDAFVAFAERNGMEAAGHTLVWHSQTPNWVFEGTTPPPAADGKAKPQEKTAPPTGAPPTGAPPAGAPPTGAPPTGAPPTGAPPAGAPPAGAPPAGAPPAPNAGGPRFRPFNLDGPRATREELLERMREHIHTVVGRYKGRIKVWDVVNEAISDNGPDVLRRSPWSVIIGPDFIEKAFEYAHEADPNAILRYNDYGLENPEKRKKLLTLIRGLQEKKVPIHAIGTQAHLNVTITFDTMDQCLSELKSLGLPIHVTELDVNGAMGGQRGFGADIGGNASATDGGLVAEADKKLTEAYTGVFKALLKHRDAIRIVTFWGPNDANSWRGRGRPLLFDSENRPKPAFDAVIRLAAPPQ